MATPPQPNPPRKPGPPAGGPARPSNPQAKPAAATKTPPPTQAMKRNPSSTSHTPAVSGSASPASQSGLPAIRTSQSNMAPPTRALPKGGAGSGHSSTMGAAASTGRLKALNSDNIAANRRALGLSEVKLSDQIKGLDKAAERAEKLANREEEKRKGGGKVMVNRALLNDGTGSRWTRKVILGIGGLLLIGGVVGGGMLWFSNRKSEDPKVAQRETSDRLMRYEKLYTPRMPPFEPEDSVSAEIFKERLVKFVETEFANEQKVAKLEQDTRKSISPDIRANLKRLEGDLTFKDAKGHDFSFSAGPEDSIVIKTSQGPEDSVQVTIPRRQIKDTKKKAPAR
ncbi:MAG: hypothetical protein KIS92_09520 [Planctomycetota bacterium]|nr:hypothetical protein [Planctomycetota bacterium]